MAASGIVLTLVTIPECEPCEEARTLVLEFLLANDALDIDVAIVDGLEDSDEVVRSRVASHPTLILAIDGRERARLAGTMTSRKILRSFLPALYRDDRVALSELRRQLESPSEEFPTGPRRARVRQAEKLELLRSVPLFAGFSKRQLTQIARLADEIHRDVGEVVIEEGQQGDEFFVVAQGAAHVVRRGRLIAELGAADHFGEMSLLDDQPRSATVMPVAPTTLLVVHRSDFDRHLMRNPEIMRTMLTTLSQRLR